MRPLSFFWIASSSATRTQTSNLFRCHPEQSPALSKKRPGAAKDLPLNRPIAQAQPDCLEADSSMGKRNGLWRALRNALFFFGAESAIGAEVAVDSWLRIEFVFGYLLRDIFYARACRK